MSKPAISKPTNGLDGPDAGLDTGSLNFLALYRAEAIERISIVKRGMPARTVAAMTIPTNRLVTALGLARATVDRKARENKALSAGDSARLLGMARLVGQVQQLAAESGFTDGFEAAAWVAQWLECPLPALDGQKPAAFMDTDDGQAIVSTLVARMQVRTYS